MPVTNALIAVDQNDDIACLRTVARDWSKKSDAHLIIVGVTPALSAAMTNPKVVALAKDAEGMMLNDLRNRIERLGENIDAPVDHHLLSGRTADEIIKAAVLHDADFVVKAADRGAGQKSPLFGATEKKLIRKCPTPVWIVRKEQDAAPKRIAVAIDNTDDAANQAEAVLLAASLLKHAIDLAKRFDIDEVTVIHAWEPHGLGFLQNRRAGLSEADIDLYIREWEEISTKWLNRFIEEANTRFAKLDVALKPHLVMGDARTAIPDAVDALGADLLVIGSANRSGVPGLFIGNTAENIIDRLASSVFVVKPSGFKSVFTPDF